MRTEDKRSRGGLRSQFVLANQILDMVRDRRMERGEHLAEPALARRLGVSRTPVRAALDLLAREEVVVSRRNHGYTLAKGWSELRSLILPVPQSEEEELYLRIIRDRLSGRIPESVTQVALLNQLGVNRALLLRTLERMAKEGLIVKKPGHGWSFPPGIDTALALRNSYDFRLAVEPAVFFLDSFRIDAVALARARSRHLWLVEQGDELSASSRQLFEIDAEFHDMLASFSGNSFFVQAVEHQNRLRRLFEYQGYWNVRRIHSWAREHLAVMDALWAENRRAAAEQMRRHLMQSYREAIKIGAAHRAAVAGNCPDAGRR